MTPEQLSRLRTYDPHFDNPHPPEIDRPPADRLELRLAVTLAVLAAGAIAVGIAWGLS